MATSLGELEVRRGDQWVRTITDTDTSNAPTDLTVFGTTWTAQARVSEDATPAITIALDTSQLAAGLLGLSMSGTVTGALDQDRYGFDIQVTGGTVSPFTVYEGRLKLVKDWTHA